jgi:hypothetical protein
VQLSIEGFDSDTDIDDTVSDHEAAIEHDEPLSDSLEGESLFDDRRSLSVEHADEPQLDEWGADENRVDELPREVHPVMEESRMDETPVISSGLRKRSHGFRRKRKRRVLVYDDSD